MINLSYEASWMAWNRCHKTKRIWQSFRSIEPLLPSQRLIFPQKIIFSYLSSLYFCSYNRFTLAIIFLNGHVDIKLAYIGTKCKCLGSWSYWSALKYKNSCSKYKCLGLKYGCQFRNQQPYMSPKKNNGMWPLNSIPLPNNNV